MDKNEEVSNVLQFLKLVGDLKHMTRTGWVLRDIKSPETIAGHMYRMSMMTFLLNDKNGLNTTRCMKMALVHDLAECIVGDITPHCGISKEVKKAAEMKAMGEICTLAGTAGQEIMNIFEEYEQQETLEAKTVKELDVFDMILQAYEYEKQNDQPKSLQEFFDSTADRQYANPVINALVSELRKIRNEHQQPLPNVREEADGMSDYPC